MPTNATLSTREDEARSTDHALWGRPPPPPRRRKGVMEGLMGGGQNDFIGLGRTSRKAQQLCKLGVTGCARVSTVAGSSRGFSDGPAAQVCVCVCVCVWVCVCATLCYAVAERVSRLAGRLEEG
jgi:hypothetical protein